MILARIQEQESHEIVAAHRDKAAAKVRTRGQQPHFSIHSRHTIDQPSSSSPNKFPFQSPETRSIYSRTGSPERPDRTCSNFMKSFIEKLKKQRKRERKKLIESNQNKHNEKQPSIGWDMAPLPLIPQPYQQILVFERINPSSFKSALIQPVPSSKTIATEKIEDIISEIKYHKQKLGRQAMRKRLSEGLPLLEGQKSERVRQKRKEPKIQNLDPWQGDGGHNDLVFQELR